MKQNSFTDIPENFIKKWQEIADLIANIINIPAALIMKTENEFMEVFVSSKTENNPYNVGDKEHWHGLYCETVIKTQNTLLIPNALKNENWDKNPDIKLGMIAYLGIPINFPDNQPFGTLCVLDNKENKFTNENEKILNQFKNVIEIDLALIQSLDLKENIDNKDILKKLIDQNDEYLAINEELKQTNYQLFTEKEKVSESEKHFRLLVENAPDAIFIQTEWKFAYINKKGLELFGAENSEQLIGKSVMERFHPDFEKKVKERIIGLNEQKQIQSLYEQIYIKLDGTHVPVETTAIPYKYQEKDGALVFVRDTSERKRLEQDNKKTFGLLRNLAAQVPGVIYQYRLYPDGRSAFPYSSEGMYQIYEVTSEEVREDASPVFTRIHPDDYDYIVETINASAKNQTIYHSKFRVILPKQGLRWRLCNAMPELLEDGSTLWHGIIMDITEEKIKEDLLKESEEKFKSIFNNHSAIKLIINPETWQIVEANHAAELFYGWSVAELIEMKISDINALNPDEITLEMKRAKARQNILFEFQHRKADGNIADVEVFSSKVTISGKEYLHSIIHDVTEKKKNEQLIKLLSHSVEQSPVSIIITDKNGIINFVNKAFTQISGYSFADLKNQTPRILNSGHQPKKTYQNLWQTILSGKVWTGELLNKKKNGELYWINCSISSIKNSKGEITNFVSVREDITEKKNILNELIAAKEKAEESDRLKSSFLQNMSHEVRTPLNAIVGFSRLIVNSKDPIEKQKKFADVITQSSDKLIEIITDVIEISQIQAKQISPKMTDFAFDKLISETTNKFKTIANDKNLQFNVLTNFDLLTINSDFEKIQKVLFHLIDNAIKFTHRGNISINYKLVDNKLEISISDTGIGISDEMQKVIFKPFRQVETGITRNFGGNGLGLAIAKAYIELLNGSISVKSKTNEGTTFYIAIPINRKTEADKNTINKLKNKQKHTVLIVEDEESNFMYLNELLDEYSFEILHAINGQEAIDYCRNNNEIDLIFMDIKMPVMDGHTAAKLIKEFRAEIPIIAQTAYALDSEQARYSGVFDDYLTKPIKEDILHEKVAKYMNNK